FQGPHEALWLDRLAQEHDNLLAALEWSLGEGDAAQDGLRLAAALWWFWFARNDYSEGGYWLARALERSPHAPPALRAEALIGAGRIAAAQVNHAAARRLCEQGLALAQALDEQPRLALALYALGSIAIDQEDYPAARSRFEQSLALRRAIGDRWGITQSLNGLAEVARAQGDDARAEALYREALTTARVSRNLYGLSLLLPNL